MDGEVEKEDIPGEEAIEEKREESNKRVRKYAVPSVRQTLCLIPALRGQP